ncbi:hypothetical protein TNCT_574261, partial [Trichonephila clavata]
YVGILVELTRIDGTKHGSAIASQMLDVAFRVQAIRNFAVSQMWKGTRWNVHFGNMMISDPKYFLLDPDPVNSMASGLLLGITLLLLLQPIPDNFGQKHVALSYYVISLHRKRSKCIWVYMICSNGCII